MITRLRKRLLLDERPQYQVAAAIGIHPSTLSIYSLGRRYIKPKHMVLLTRYYQCNPEDLIGWLDEPDMIDWINAEAAAKTPTGFHQTSQGAK